MVEHGGFVAVRTRSQVGTTQATVFLEMSNLNVDKIHFNDYW